MQYHIVRHGTAETLTLILDGELRTVGDQHPTFPELHDYLADGGDDPEHVHMLLDAHRYAATGLTRLSERVSLDHGQITFDGDVIDTALTRHLLRLLREGSDAFRPVVAFMEKLAANPSPLSRHHLWTWLHDRDFSLTPNGDVIGYKAVRADQRSRTAGQNTVLVDGAEYTGHVPNPIGATVEMPRTQIDPDREHGCSIGLHVGTWDYAEGFGGPDGRVLTVTVNPRDVVAVPRDHDCQKMRVCRYTVQTVSHTQHETALVAFLSD